jgi:SNF2 family DNA or RNA helicase
VPAKRREDEVDRFQRGDGDVFLISLKAGGTGLNLTSATYVIHLDPWWNPAAEDQATDRAHRIGQEQPVTVYRLVAEDTVEDGVLELQEAKRELVTGLLEGTGRAAPFDMDELAELMTRTARGYGD